jgi:hypothetical protein
MVPQGGKVADPTGASFAANGTYLIRKITSVPLMKPGSL